MKVALFLAGLVSVVQGATYGMYKDMGCSEPLLEYTSGKDRKYKYSTHVYPFNVGVCTVVEPAMEVEYDAGSASAKYKITQTFGVSCSEFGGASFKTVGKDHSDCIVDGEKLSGEDGQISEKSGIASYCVPKNENGIDEDQDETWYKIDCNPNDGSVASIVLSTIGLVLSLAAIGLAAVASGKKGGGGAPAAKPAEPAVPQEGNVQGSTTAAAAVGAATDA